MNPAHWLSNLAAWSAQAAILVAVGSLAAWIFRLRAPRVRLAYGHALLAACLLLPAVEPWRIATESNIDITTSVGRPVPGDHAAAPPLPWRLTLLIVVAAGCVGRMLWLAVGFGKLRAWRAASRPLASLPPEIEQLRNTMAPRAELLWSASISGPVTFGAGRPVVMLPRHFAGLPADAQEVIACHELLHVRRRDWIVTVLEELVRAALWFHPAIWWLISQIQLAREQTVDAEVVGFTRNRTLYLNTLLAMAGTEAALDLAPATLFLRKRHLKKRVALLLKEGTMSKRRLISFCATSCGLLLAAGWLALHTFPLQAAPAAQNEDSAKLLHSVPPKYPEAAREKHIEGAVVLEVQIDAEGHVSDARAISGPTELRSAALEAVLQWHYSPKAMSLPTTTQVTMEFKLPKDQPAETAARTSLPTFPPFTLKSIQVEGLSAAARDELLQRLTVHVGDTVDPEAMRTMTETVRGFDDHLLIAKGPDEGTLKIFVAPHVSPQGPQSPRIRVGGNVQQAKLVSQVHPIYPAEAKAQGIQGVVRLEAVLDKDGKVENLQVVSGDPILAAAAIEAVKNWQYQTTLLNGDPVEVVTRIDVNFTLSK
ncbi:MAG TPA: M56 family metallopeptidase [Bryobacteraceae bacterium]|nr:M56 family metallopeptidase [Bryobacteraceae bacterium]